MGLFRRLVADTLSIARTYGAGRVTPRSLSHALMYDGTLVLAATRAREAARRWHVPGVNRALRLAQIALYGIEIGKDVKLGEGVVFVHTLGIVIGGDAEIGDRVRMLGNITIGTAKENGYPKIGADVVIGAGARILGPVRIGDGAVIGANAVVVSDVPAGATAIGVPAVIRAHKAVHAVDRETNGA